MTEQSEFDQILIYLKENGFIIQHFIQNKNSKEELSSTLKLHGLMFTSQTPLDTKILIELPNNFNSLQQN